MKILFIPRFGTNFWSKNAQTVIKLKIRKIIGSKVILILLLDAIILISAKKR